MGIKVYFNYEGEGDVANTIMSSRMDREAYKAKITIPDGWLAGPCEKLLAFFVQTYNKKFSGKELVEAEMRLRVGDVELPVAGTVSQFVQEHNDIYVEHRVKVVTTTAAPEGSVVCGNFGCGQRYMPDDNHDTACHYHAKGPVFHDTHKYWGCCPDQKALDWEDFEAIPKCMVGHHAQVDRTVTFQSPNTILNQALSAEQAAAMASGAPNAGSSVDGPRRTGPREFELHEQTDVGAVDADGTGRCRNPGCGKRFVVSENNENACQYHCAGPVFWDTYKYWKCCPDKKHIDFDDFAKVEGCTRGPHKL